MSQQGRYNLIVCDWKPDCNQGVLIHNPIGLFGPS